MHGQLFESLAYFRVYYLKKNKVKYYTAIDIKNFKYMYNLVTILYWYLYINFFFQVHVFYSLVFIKISNVTGYIACNINYIK